MSVRRPLFAIVTSLAMVASGLTAAGAANAAPSVAPGPNGYVPPPISWGRCEKDLGLPKRAQCGDVVVPRDWNDIGGTTITVAVSRVRHTTKRFQGVMLVNPGGPGGTGREYAGLQGLVPKGAGKSYDWIGFDPRGVGASKPSLTCDPGFDAAQHPPYRPTTKAIERAWITVVKQYVAGCEQRNRDVLPYITSESTTKDMDAIRAALGQDRINFYGYSYGTYLGELYATLFPSHLRRAVLDSNVDPRSVWAQANLDQNLTLEKTMQRFFAWVAAYDSVYHLGSTAAEVERRNYAVQRGLYRHPVAGFGGNEWNDALINAGYGQYTWPDLAKRFSQWAVGGRKAALQKLKPYAGVYSDNLYAVYTAIQCNESRWPGSFAVYAADVRRSDRVAPFISWANGWLNAPCLYWPIEPVAPVEVGSSAAPPMLLVDQTLDGATPYAGSLEVRRRFPSSVLLAEPGGTTHATTLFEDNGCVDAVIVQYLRDGTLPERKPGGGADTTCRPLPLPTP